MKPKKGKKKKDDTPLVENPVVGKFVLEVLANGGFQWKFDNINPITILGMLNCAEDELRRKLREGEFRK
ncbi:MAG: hypothetical protein HWN68_19370 [Desulfobacterales bacterium]|nr:hypothetical protein [Desulfobacterales bacterium]